MTVSPASKTPTSVAGNVVRLADYRERRTQRAFAQALELLMSEMAAETVATRIARRRRWQEEPLFIEDRRPTDERDREISVRRGLDPSPLPPYIP